MDLKEEKAKAMFTDEFGLKYEFIFKAVQVAANLSFAMKRLYDLQKERRGSIQKNMQITLDLLVKHKIEDVTDKNADVESQKERYMP